MIMLITLFAKTSVSAGFTRPLFIIWWSAFSVNYKAFVFFWVNFFVVVGVVVVPHCTWTQSTATMRALSSCQRVYLMRNLVCVFFCMYLGSWITNLKKNAIWSGWETNRRRITITSTKKSDNKPVCLYLIIIGKKLNDRMHIMRDRKSEKKSLIINSRKKKQWMTNMGLEMVAISSSSCQITTDTSSAKHFFSPLFDFIEIEKKIIFWEREKKKI